MNIRLLIISIVLIFISGNIYADPDDGVLDLFLENKQIIEPQSNICLSVTADDFEDVSFAQIPIQWDPEKLTFTDIADEAFSGSIQVANQDVGTLRYIVQDATLNNPMNLADGGKLFDICFDILFTDCQKTEVTLEDITEVPPDFPLECINSQDLALTFTIENGSFEIYCLPLSFCLDAAEYVMGETNCVSLFTTEFDNVQSFQFSMDYDPSELKWTGVSNLNEDLGLADSDFNEPILGNIRVSWFDLGGTGKILDNCTLLAEICFDVIATPSSENPVSIGDIIPGGIEGTDAQNQLLEIATNCSCMLTSLVNLEEVNLTISPNPVFDQLSISINSFQQKGTVRVISSSGKTVIEKVYSKAGEQLLLDVSALQAGIYFLKIEDAYSIGTQKFIKR